MKAQVNMFWFRTLIVLMVIGLFNSVQADGLPSPDEVTVDVIQNNPVDPGLSADKKKDENDVTVKVTTSDGSKPSEDDVPVRPGYGHGDDNNMHSGPPGKDSTNMSN